MKLIYYYFLILFFGSTMLYIHILRTDAPSFSVTRTHKYNINSLSINLVLIEPWSAESDLVEQSS